MTLVPDFYCDDIYGITPEYIKEKGIDAVILDIDNTLIGHNVPMPDEKVMAHLRLLESEGIKLCVVSNNRYERVKNFSEKIGVRFFVHDALKPKARGYLLAAKEMELDKKNIGAVGDQIFTDVWGARRAGCFAIYTTPIHQGGAGFFIAVKRLLEKPFLRKR